MAQPGPKHEVAALQPAAREQEPRGREPGEKIVVAMESSRFPIPATSNVAHGFPAYTLTCLLHLKGYGTYPAGATFGCSLLTL
jgi:hypothetical protein